LGERTIKVLSYGLDVFPVTGPKATWVQLAGTVFRLNYMISLTRTHSTISSRMYYLIMLTLTVLLEVLYSGILQVMYSYWTQTWSSETLSCEVLSFHFPPPPFWQFFPGKLELDNFPSVFVLHLFWWKPRVINGSFYYGPDVTRPAVS